MSGITGNNPYRASGVIAAAAGGGAVDWCTTVKTGALCAAAGKGYFVNTSCGAITVTLPTSPTAGDIVAVKDYGGTWQTNNVTLGRGGSKINGECDDATLDTEAQSVTMIYVDATKGWQDVNDSTADVTGVGYLTATGGTEVTCGDWKTHIFTGAGTFCVSALGGPTRNTVEYLVIAGGGANGYGTPSSGGGGGGGFRYFSALSPAGSPLVAPAGITVTASPYTIAVGAGGAVGPAAPQPNPAYGYNGAVSTFSTICSAGGGSGGYHNNGVGMTGGSGGGGGNASAPITITPGGAGDTPDVEPDQGNDGGAGGQLAGGPAPNHRQGGGGGGAGAAGTTVTPSTNGGAAGDGSYIPDGFVGPTAPTYGTPGPTGGGAGGAGGGTAGSSGPGNASDAVAVNLGGGAGGVMASAAGLTAGGTGIVMIRYQYQ